MKGRRADKSIHGPGLVVLALVGASGMELAAARGDSGCCWMSNAVRMSVLIMARPITYGLMGRNVLRAK